MCNKLSPAMVILKKKPAPLKSQCLSEHLQERVRGMFARELGAARQLTEEVPQHPANARKINTAREVRLRVRLSATWTKNRATDFTRVPGVWFFARQRTSKIYFQWENNRQITPRSQKQDCLVSYMVSAHTFLLLSQKEASHCIAYCESFSSLDWLNFLLSSPDFVGEPRIFRVDTSVYPYDKPIPRFVNHI